MDRATVSNAEITGQYGETTPGVGAARCPGPRLRLNLIAGLGIRTLRYPVLWERTAPDGLESADWSWPDERLARLRELEIRSLVGV